MTTYRGYSDALHDTRGPIRVLAFPRAGAPYPLRHVIYHSPTGLQWGYAGSGPRDLALSLLADYLGEVTDIPPQTPDAYYHAFPTIEQSGAYYLHNDFVREVIAQLPQGDTWTLTSVDLHGWVAPRRRAMRHAVAERRATAMLFHTVITRDGIQSEIIDVVDHDGEVAVVLAHFGTVPFDQIRDDLGIMED